MPRKFLPDHPIIPNQPNDEFNLGSRLHELRSARGLSLRALAVISGLNVNTLSLIENQRTSPSVSTLQQLAQALNIPISSLFENDQYHNRVAHQKAGTRPLVAFKHGSIEDLGAGMSRFGAEPFIITLDPNVDSGKNPIVHTGREFVYCLLGHIAYKVDSETYLLGPGDSLLFEAYLPHQWKNLDPTPSSNLLLLCPLDERDRPTERHFS